MITTLTLGIVVQFLDDRSRPADRLDLASRLMRLDDQWLRTKSEERRRDAIPGISMAVNAFFSGKFNPGCQALDQAFSTLTNQRPLGANFSHRVEALLIDAVERPQVSSKKLYDIDDIPKVEKLDEKQRRLDALTRKLNDDRNAKLRQVTKIPSLYVLLRKHMDSPNPDVRAWAMRMKTYTKGETPEYEENVGNEWKALQRAAEDPKPQNFWFSSQGRTKFHLRWPRRFDPKNLTVAIGLHGAGGSPAMFVKSYGSGICAEEANRRGWLFMSPDSTPNAPKDCLDWLEKRDFNVGRFIVMGHSMGGGNTVAYAGSRARKPNAVVLFAPATSQMPRDLEIIPTYLTVGRQEIPMLRAGASNLAKQGQNWPRFLYEEADPCEHLMIVASKARDAYKFLDRELK